MTLLQKTYQILQQETKEQQERGFIKPTRPTKEVLFNSFKITSNNYQTKERLSKVLAFIDMKKQSRFSDGLTVMNISCTNKRLLSMCGTSMSVSRLIKYMIEIGLLAEYDETYQYNAFYNRDNKCKQYCYKYETEVLVKEYCKDNNINKYKVNNNKHNTITIVNTIDSFEPSEVKFSSKLNLLKPDNWTTTQFEDYLTQLLYENYPQLEHYQDLADQINETFYKDDFDRQIQFVPSFTWRKGNKCVTKIGIRATNALVSAKKEKEDDDRENQLYREELLERYNLNYEFDVKSSVPRVTYLMNNGFWLDDDVDLYQMMYDRFIKKCPTEELEWNKETRDIFKSFHMRGYFDTYAKIAAHIKREISKRAEYKKEDWNSLDYLMKSYKEAIKETIGELKYDSEIFFHESCIYLDVLSELLNRGYNVLQVYDGFYTDKEVKDIKQIVEDKANNYINNNNNNESNKDNIITIVNTINNFEDWINLKDISANDRKIPVKVIDGNPSFFKSDPNLVVMGL